jgi:hypothetical protein
MTAVAKWHYAIISAYSVLASHVETFKFREIPSAKFRPKRGQSLACFFRNSRVMLFGRRQPRARLNDYLYDFIIILSLCGFLDDVSIEFCANGGHLQCGRTHLVLCSKCAIARAQPCASNSAA